jgi:hypothetical protein
LLHVKLKYRNDMEQLYLYILLIATLPVIAVLAFALCRCRRRLSRCQEAMVRLINENLDMKEKLPAHERPNFMNRGDITPEEFTEIIHNMLKRLMFLSLFFLVAVYPMKAQEKQDTTYLFRFVADKDMFYSPWNGNGEQLARLLKCVDENRSAIESGQMYLLVTSYGTDGNAGQPATEVAKVRRNRVKSELIMRGKVKETHFVTDRSFDAGYTDENGKSLRNIVIVTLPASADKVAEIAGEEAATKVEAYNKEVSGEAERERIAAEKARVQAEEARMKAEEERIRQEEVRIVAEKNEAERKATEAEHTDAKGTTPKIQKEPEQYHVALRANLLRWATLTPDLGLEWRINSSWSIVANGSWTSWSWNDKDRRYAIWEVIPEVRYYIGEQKAWYVGAMFKTGQFNYKLSGTGKQGDLMGGGITGGYQLRLNKALSMDFNLGLGYLNADYEKYKVIDGVRVRQGKESKNWWGPVSAGVTLVWTIF